MKTRSLAILAGALLVGALSFSTLGVAQARTSGAPGAGCGGGYGMMGGSGGGGMMGGSGGSGMMGGSGGYGTTGPWGPGPATDGVTLTLEEARQAVEQSLAENGLTNLAVDEVMEFDCNFYAIAEGRDTGKAAMELLIDKTTGAVFPEYGPSMMWNTEYGHMGGLGRGATGRTALTPEQARERAKAWLDRFQPGSTTEEPDAFPGYYTLHIEKDGRTTGMLSVHGTTGRVWYHSWHGDFIAEAEY